MLHQVHLCLLVSIQLLELLDEGLCYRNEGLFGPRKEPVNRALVEKSGEFSKPVSEFLADGREAKTNVQIVSDSVDKVVVKLAWRRVCALELLDVISSGIAEEGLFFVLRKQAWDLTSGEDHVDELEELFLLNFRVSEDETAVLAETTSDFEVLLDVFFQVFLGIVLYQLDLLVLHSLDECREPCERLFTASSYSDQQSR